MVMKEIDWIENFTDLSRASRVFAATYLLLPLVGICCLLIPELVEVILPYFLGGVMILAGVAGIVIIVREKQGPAGGNSIGTSLVMIVLGCVTMFLGSQSINFIGVIWGLLSLEEAAEKFDELVHRAKDKKPFVISLIVNIVVLVLAVLLLIDPFANFEHHLIILGLQLIIFPFNQRVRKHRKESGNAEIQAAPSK